MELGSSSLTNRFLATMEGNGPNGITFTVSGGRPNYYITSTDGVLETQELFADYDLVEGSHTYDTLNSGTYKFVVGDTDGSVWQFGPVTLPFVGKIIGISQSITPRVDVPYTLTNCTFTWTDCYGGNGSGLISSGEIKHVCSSTRPTSTGCRLITNRLGDCSNAFCTTTTAPACTCYSVIPVTTTTTAPAPFTYYALKVNHKIPLTTTNIIGDVVEEDKRIYYAVCKQYTVYQFYDTYNILAGSNATLRNALADYVKRVWDAGLKPVFIVGDGIGLPLGQQFDVVYTWEQTVLGVRYPGYKLWGVNYEHEYWNTGAFAAWIADVNYVSTTYPGRWNFSAYVAGTPNSTQATQIVQATIDILEVTNYDAAAPNPSGVSGYIGPINTAAVALSVTQDFVPLWSAEKTGLVLGGGRTGNNFSGAYFAANGPTFFGPLATWTSGYSSIASSYPNMNFLGGLCMFDYDDISYDGINPPMSPSVPPTLPCSGTFTTTTTTSGGGQTTTSTTSGGGGGQLNVSCNGPTCDNARNGSMTVSPVSTSSPFVYKFTKGVLTYSFNSSSTTFTYDGFESGTWNVTVTDSQNNVENGSCTLTQTFTHSFTATGSNVTFTLTGGFGSPSNTNYWIASADSSGNQDGRVFVSNIGNDGNYPLTSLPNGSYVFLVGDTDGCVYQFQSVTLPAASPVIRTITPIVETIPIIEKDCAITWTDCYGGSGTVGANYGQEIFVCSSSRPTSLCDLVITDMGNCNDPRCTTTTTTSCLCYIIEVASPQIISFSPTSGPVGTTVTITGVNLGGAFQITINGLSVTTFTVVNGTTVTFVVPAGANSGPITVTTPGGTATSTTIFVVTLPPTPTPSATQTLTPTLTSTPAVTSTPTSTPTPTTSMSTPMSCSCTLLTYFTISPAVLNQSSEVPKKVYLEFVRCGGVLTVTHELPVAATYFDYSDLPIKYCVNTANLSTVKFYVYTSPSTTVNVTSSVTTVRENGLCDLCVTSLPTPATCDCAKMSVFISDADVIASDDQQARIHYYDCNGILQESLISNVGNDVYLLEEFCVKTGGTYTSAIEVVYLTGGVLSTGSASYTVVTGCCDANSFLYRGSVNTNTYTLNNQPLTIPASSCKYQYTDCNGVQQPGTINAGEQLAVCSSFPPTGLGCSISYTIQGDCTNCQITTTTTTCPCFTLDSVNIDANSLQMSFDNPKTIYLKFIPCGKSAYDPPIAFTNAGGQIVPSQTPLCATLGSVQFYYEDAGTVQVIDTASTVTYGDCCACYNLTLSTATNTNTNCVDLVSDPLINAPTNWQFNSYNGTSVGSAIVGELQITEGTPAGNFIGVAYGDGTPFVANDCINGTPRSIQITYDIEIHPNIIDGLGEFKLYISDSTGSPTLPGAVTIIDFGQLAPGANPTGTVTVTPPPYTYSIWMRYLRKDFAPTNAPIIPGRQYPIIQSMTVFTCSNAIWTDCNGCLQEALVIPNVNVPACVFNGFITYEPGIVVANNGLCSSASQRVGFTTTTTTACHECFYIDFIYISQEAIDASTNGTVYFQYTQCVTEETITLSFTDPGNYYLDGSDCIELLSQRQFYVLVQYGDLQTYVNFDDYCYYNVGGECCFPQVVTTTTLTPPEPIIGTTTTTTCPCVELDWVVISVNPQDYDMGQLYLSYKECNGNIVETGIFNSGITLINVCSDRSYQSYIYGYIEAVLYSGSTLGQIVTADCCPY